MCFVYIGAHNVYGTFWNTWSSTKSQQNLYSAYLFQIPQFPTVSLLTFRNCSSVRMLQDSSLTLQHLHVISFQCTSHHRVVYDAFTTAMVQGCLNLKIAGKISSKTTPPIVFARLGRKEAGMFKWHDLMVDIKGTNSKNVRGIEISNRFGYIQED